MASAYVSPYLKTVHLSVFKRGLTFVKNNFGGAVPEVKLDDDESELTALITRELKSYIDNLEKIK